VRVPVPNWIGLPSYEKAQIPDHKLRDYALCPTHQDGGPKAKYFQGLDIGPEDWEYLRDEIIKGLPQARITAFVFNSWFEGGRRCFGIQYEVPVSILGHNGQRREIVTAWKPGPVLITVRPPH
jgi:uncharacterized protein DUF6883